jgi:RHS repeat-associated protein
MPYFSATWEYTAPDSNVKFITNVYDPIGRLAEVIKPDNTSIRQYYCKYDTFTVDELGHVTNQRIEGNIEYDIKYTGIYPSHTEYSRTTKITACDGTKIIDPLQKVFTTGLDMLERTVSATSPMNGTWTYVYDGNDNMISRTDAKNQTMLFEYDIMNRMTKKTYPDGSYVSYYFDETGHGYAKGRQTRIVYPSGSESYTYDVRGRKTAINQTISGLSRTKTMMYNSMDQLTSQTYPDGEVLNYTYDAGGLLSKLNGATTYVNDINYFASDKISKMDFGNGVQTEYDYYDTASESDSSAGTTFSYRLRQIRVYKPGSEIFNLNYEYEKNDNLKVKQDLSNNKFTETYGYDDLNRLISANSTSYGSKTYQYDVLNNILRKDNRTYKYDTANPYKLLNDGRYTYTYDANGSITGRSDGMTLGWDYENRLTSIFGGNAYAYNADEQRIKKTENGVTTYYFFNDYEEEYTGGVKTKSVKYYFADKQRITERSSVDGVHYYHQDHLSSSTAITDASGNLVLRNNYAPYGEDAVSDGNANVKYKFSDKEKDIPGFYYYGARYYDPVLGRFISVDPAKQELNWYAYCGNNPVKYVDPDGTIFDTILDAIFIAFDIVEVATDPTNPMNWASLIADVGCAFVPGATGGGTAVKAADKAADAAKVASTAEKVIISSSKKLGENMVKSGIKRGVGEAAHHIVAGNAAKAAPARVILKKFGIGINDAANGMFLKTSQHVTQHTNKYYAAINKALAQAQNKNDVLKILQDISHQIKNGTFPK